MGPPLLLAVAILLPPDASGQAAPSVRRVTVDVEGQTVEAVCVGGNPEAVLLHAGDADAGSWTGVLQALAGRVSACAYGRPGGARGSGGAAERGWYEFLAETGRIHDALDAAPRYVVVGAGLAGLYGRLLAVDLRSRVGGLVLIEPHHEDLPDRIRRGMPAAEWASWQKRRQRPNRDGLVEVDLAVRARAIRLPDIPLTVVTATERLAEPGWDPRWIDQGVREVHRSLVVGHPGARHLPAPGAGPRVEVDDPRLVADEVARVVGLMRGERPR